MNGFFKTLIKPDWDDDLSIPYFEKKLIYPELYKEKK